MEKQERDLFINQIQENVLLADGAMGTYFNQKYMSEMEAEEANLEAP